MAKSRLKSEERKQQILDKAADVFAIFGLAGARTRDIAAACDINEAVIYKHFESKEELFRESLRSKHSELAKDLYALVEGEPNGLAALKASLDLQIHKLLLDPAIRAYVLHGAAAATLDAEMKKWTGDWFYTQNEFVRGLLERGIGDGSIRPDIETEVIIWQIKGAGWVCMLEGIFGKSEAEISDLARKLFKSILDSIAA